VPHHGNHLPFSWTCDCCTHTHTALASKLELQDAACVGSPTGAGQSCTNFNGDAACPAKYYEEDGQLFQCVNVGANCLGTGFCTKAQGFHCDFSQGTPCGGVLGGASGGGFPKFANNQLYLIQSNCNTDKANFLALDDFAATAAFTATWKGKLTGGNGFVFNYGPECKSTNIPDWKGGPVHSAVCKDFKGLHVQYRRWENRVYVWMDGTEVKQQSCDIQKVTGIDEVEHKITVDANKGLTVEYYGSVVFSAFQLPTSYAPTAAWTYMLGFGNGGGKGDVYLNTLDIEAGR